MKKNPLFANTCGMIYDDSATFAFEHKEKSIRLDNIKKARINVGMSLKSLFVTLMPLSFLGFVYLINNMDFIFKIILILLTIVFTSISLYNAERTFHLVLVMKDGSRFKIRFSENNKKDAEKFVNNLNLQIK